MDAHSLTLSISISSADHSVIQTQGALEEGVREVLVVYDKPIPCKFPSLDSCQKRFMWAPKAVDAAPHQVTGLVLHVEDVEKFFKAHFWKPSSFFQSR